MKNTKILTEAGIAIAMAVVLGFIKLWSMPQGGSVSLEMIPILVVAYRRGAKTGLLTGAVYGVLSLIFAGTIYHPMSILLDYILAFASLGLAGIFMSDIKGIIAGSTIGVGGRFLFSFLSGWLLFGDYAPEGQNPALYSLIYQASYLLPELLITVGVLLFMAFKANGVLRRR